MPRVVVHQELLGSLSAAPLPIAGGVSKDARKSRLSPLSGGTTTSHSCAEAAPRTARPQRLAVPADALIKEFSAAAAEWIQKLCEPSNRAEVSKGVAASSFVSHAIPPVSVEAYIARFVQWTGSATCLVIALALLSRLRALVTPLTVHRMLLGAFVLAVKLHEESFHPLAYYALMGGVNVANLRQLERDTYDALGFSCLVAPEEFRGVVNGLRRLYPKTKGGAPLDDSVIPTEVPWDALLPPMV